MADSSDDPDCVIIDTFKAKDNILLLSEETLTVASVPPAEATELVLSGWDGLGDRPRWTIPVAALREVKGLATGLELTYIDDRGRSVRFDHRADHAQKAEFLDQIRSVAENEWREERSHESRLVGFSIFFGAALLFAAITAFFHFGVEYGWIQRAPTFVATIYNLFGAAGILAAGGLLTAVCLAGGVKAIVSPAEVICLRRSSSTVGDK